MNRLEMIRKVVDYYLIQIDDIEHRRDGFIHLYGVSQFCSLLALKRGLNPEICAIAGMLHDISTYQKRYTPDHGKLGAIEARRILNESRIFSEDEIDIICNSISKHSDKDKIEGSYDEVLKDADVLQHNLYNTEISVDGEKERMDKICKELGVL